MKHKYEDLSDEARELVLHGDNSEHLYRTSHEPIAKNLAKKMAKGTYDEDKARKLWGYHAERAAQSYQKEMRIVPIINQRFAFHKKVCLQ